MDCCFNRFIPESTADVIVLRPHSKTWLNGLAMSYDQKFPRQLDGIMTRQEFYATINEVNNLLFDDWPCLLCFSCGYLLCCCTLGLSFCPSFLMVQSATKHLKKLLSEVNEAFQDRGIQWRLFKRNSTSWIEISLNMKLINST